MFAIDEQTKHDELKEVVESVRIFGNKGHSGCFLDFSSDYLGRAFNDGILNKFLSFLLPQLLSDFGFYVLYLFDEGLEDSFTTLGSSLNFAIWSFNPADRSSKVYRHHDVSIVVDEKNRMADVFFIADLMILSILVESSLILAVNWFGSIVVTSLFAADEGEFKVTALN